MHRLVDTVSSEELKKIDQVIARYKGKHGSLIPALKESQDICGYLPNRSRDESPKG